MKSQNEEGNQPIDHRKINKKKTGYVTKWVSLRSNLRGRKGGGGGGGKERGLCCVDPVFRSRYNVIWAFSLVVGRERMRLSNGNVTKQTAEEKLGGKLKSV